MDETTQRAAALDAAQSAPTPPKGDPETREQQIAKGIGFFHAGHTLDVAALESGIPRSTLWDRYQRVFGADGPDAKERREIGDRRLEAIGQGIAEHTLASMAQDLERDAEEPAEWIETFKTSYDKDGNELGRELTGGFWKRRLDPRDKANYLGVAERMLARIRRDHQDDGDGNGAPGWGKLLERLSIQGGGKASISMEIEPTTVDVTPTTGGDRG